MSERSTDSLLQRSRTSDALDLWRCGERNVTRRTLASDWRDDYRDAVQAPVALPQRYSTMAELVATYSISTTMPGWTRSAGGLPGASSTSATWTTGYPRNGCSWRRAQQLITAAAGGSGGRG